MLRSPILGSRFHRQKLHRLSYSLRSFSLRISQRHNQLFPGRRCSNDIAAQQQSSSDAKTTKINSRAQSQYNNDVPIIAKQLGVSTDEVRDSVHIDYDANGRAVVVGGHVNMTVDDGSDAQSALAARLGPGPHGYNENAATGQGQGSEFSRLGTTPSVHLDGGLLHVDRFNASAWGGLGVVPHFFYDVAYGHMQGSSNPMLPY
jgi:hypothetical protein